jgi:sulfofructosephosphate aldolase
MPGGERAAGRAAEDPRPPADRAAGHAPPAGLGPLPPLVFAGAATLDTIALATRFVNRCRAAGLISIIEPVSRRPRDGRAWDREHGVLAAARELGALGADLYKAEVPLCGTGPEAGIRRRCAELTETIASPWVVLSSGVPRDAFPRAVELACQEGASGFLAGRAVWRPVIGAPDIDAALREDAVPRLRHLAAIVDDTVQR